MIGWVIARCAPQKEHALALDIADISKNFIIPTYIPVHVFYRSVSRYTPLRKPVRELIAPRMVFMQAGYRKIAMIREQSGKLPSFEGFVLDNDGVPYTIPHDAMAQFMIAVDRTNLFVERLGQEALGRIAEAKKTTWHKLVGDEVRAKLQAMVGYLPGGRK